MIVLNYKDCKLGTLIYENGEYIYNSLDSEKVALEKYLGLVIYDLSNSNNKKSKKLFKFFKTEFLDNINQRPDILKKIGENSKNDYEILEKFCKLKCDKFNFWLSTN